MTLNELLAYLQRIPTPVILLEGTRTFPASDHPVLTEFAGWIARRLPNAVFRTGNARGADEEFARGVSAVDPSRLEYILPRRTMGRLRRDERAHQVSIEEIPEAVLEYITLQTSKASPAYQGLIARRTKSASLHAKTLYILRDTLKVVGSNDPPLSPAKAGIFYADAENPMKGGTGHTMRVCSLHSVPVLTQKEWMTWSDLLVD
jgi:hypothetical protein